MARSLSQSVRSTTEQFFSVYCYLKLVKYPFLQAINLYDLEKKEIKHSTYWKNVNVWFFPDKSDCAETVFMFLVPSYEYAENSSNPILLFCIIHIFVATYIRVYILCKS